MTIRSAEEAKEIIRRYEGAAILTKVPNLEDFDTYSRAKEYLSAFRGPEVSELVEAVKFAIYHFSHLEKLYNSDEKAIENMESALVKIEEIRK